MESTARAEKQVAEALRNQTPVRDLAGVSIANVQEQSDQQFDISFDLLSGANQIRVLAEVKSAFSPRVLEEIRPWIRRLKSLRPDVAVAVIAPQLSVQAQAFCIENGIDFLDLAGNVSINIPGKFTLQRSGMRASGELARPSEDARTVNVFSGRFSRVLRVLLQQPRSWSVSEIARELEKESRRLRESFPATDIDFTISQGSVSKAIGGLEEQLLVRRRGTAIVVPEPLRLLQQWAEKYKERYRWRLRSSFQTGNPFGSELSKIADGIAPLLQGVSAFTGASAAAKNAPFIDVDIVDVFVSGGAANATVLRDLKSQASNDPRLRLITPYDAGVFMYAQLLGPALVASPVQVYLDLYARGGRDLKQAEYLLDHVILPQWRTA
jgi:hypothetical protein